MPQSAHVKSVANNQCESRVTLPQALQGSKAFVSIDISVSADVSGQSDMPISLPSSSSLKNINFTVKAIG
ncbi:hypothetical protein [Synechococcus sp. PCC 6312]|uniref:hypothetical protein n=1 Tax=Synechococcus sp. (strain ATCC 27167 / PCC 6312) TaxID=195253 RepID=UPI00029EED14|nr:hypothetical protein [Synechococcus sp. PCC 6312]AFY61118.1 hypothetical protein Syn6312_1985 [Synechococcus sp. PCC 6312]